MLHGGTLLSAIVGFFGWLYVLHAGAQGEQANADAARYSPESLQRRPAGGPAIQGAAAVADEDGSAVTSMPVVEALATPGHCDRRSGSRSIGAGRRPAMSRDAARLRRRP